MAVRMERGFVSTRSTMERRKPYETTLEELTSFLLAFLRLEKEGHDMSKEIEVAWKAIELKVEEQYEQRAREETSFTRDR